MSFIPDLFRERAAMSVAATHSRLVHAQPRDLCLRFDLDATARLRHVCIVHP